MAWDDPVEPPPGTLPERSVRGYFFYYSAIHVLASLPFVIHKLIYHWPGLFHAAGSWESALMEALGIPGGLLGKLLWMEVHFWFAHGLGNGDEAVRLLVFLAECTLVSALVIGSLSLVSALFSYRARWFRKHGTLIYLCLVLFNILCHYLTFFL